MIEIALRVHVASLGTGAVAVDDIDRWLQRLQRLDHDQLMYLLPIVDGQDECDTLQKCIRLCTLLASPERALIDLPGKPFDDVIDSVFPMHCLAKILLAMEQGKTGEPMTLETWCCNRLTRYARQSEADAERIQEWYAREIAEERAEEPKEDPALDRPSAARDGGPPRHHSAATNRKSPPGKSQSRQRTPPVPPRSWPRGTTPRKPERGDE